MSASEKDLVVLAADKNAEYAMKGLLARPEALGIRPISVEVHVHPDRDPGCLQRAHTFLRPFVGQYTHCLVVFDRDGCGRDNLTRVELETEVERQLARAGWGDTGAALVIDPELDIWVWSDSPHLDSALGWSGRSPDLRSWLEREGFLPSGGVKARPPKEALEAALAEVRKPRSSSIYRMLAETVSLRHCNDIAFLKLGTTLRRWFAPDQPIRAAP